MKNVITLFSFLLVFGIFSASAQCCSTPCGSKGKSASTKVDKKGDKAVKAYYFHNKRRCATCQAVEEVTQKCLKEKYGNKVEFVSVTITDDEPLVKEYKVARQTLLIVGGGQKVDLTNIAFLNARTNPAKLEDKIVSTVNSIL